jgi:iron complex transport system substrate-binding protein
VDTLSELPRRGRARRLAIVPIFTALVLTGCANREQAASPTPTSTPQGQQAFPVSIVQADGKTVTIDKRPAKIVSLSASGTETLFKIGAGKEVVAVDDQSNYPAEAPKTNLSGLTPNVEAIAAYQPDLVVASGDAGDMVAGLEKLNRRVLILPAAKTFDDVYQQFEQLGKATGHAKEAEELTAKTKEDIEKIVATAPKTVRPFSYYHELTTELYSATSKTFIGQVYNMFGLTNIADPADTDAGGYPQLSPEHILKSDPELIFLADTKCCGQNAQTVATRPGWAVLMAVKSGNVVALDDDLASRWGPRITELVQAVADAVIKASKAG